MTETTTPTPPDTLRAAMQARTDAGLPPAVCFKWETEDSGPAWIQQPDGEAVPLAVVTWEDGSTSAWFPITYVRSYAERIGATVEEW